jgi:YesN/AraC family two-component response regulator
MINDIVAFDGVLKLVGTAADGESGLQMVSVLRPDLILVDTSLEITADRAWAGQLSTGRITKDDLTHNLLLNIRKNSAECIIIALSSDSDFHHIQSAIRAGISDYLLKPLKSAEIVDTLSRFIDFSQIDENAATDNIELTSTTHLNDATDLPTDQKSHQDEQSRIMRDNDMLRQYLIRAEQFVPELSSNYWMELFDSSVFRLHMLAGYDRHELLSLMSDDLRCLEINRLPSVMLIFQGAQEINDGIDKLIGALRKSSGKTLKTSSSSLLTEITALRSGFLECCRLLDQSPIMTRISADRKHDEHLFYTGRSPSNHHSNTGKRSSFSQWDKEKNLLLYIESGNTGAAVHCIDELFSCYESGLCSSQPSNFRVEARSQADVRSRVEAHSQANARGQAEARSQADVRSRVEAHSQANARGQAEARSQTNARSQVLDLGTVKHHLGNIVRSIRSLVHHYLGESYHGSENIGDSKFIRWSYDYTLLKGYVRNLVQNSAEALKPYSAYSSENPIDNIIDYLHKNFNQEITLEKLSELFYLNPSYCSTLFKKHTGTNYSLYVNQLRIDKASQLLLDEGLSISLIARTVGFSNEEYFFRVFKKITGQTPSEFRRRAAELSS